MRTIKRSSYLCHTEQNSRAQYVQHDFRNTVQYFRMVAAILSSVSVWLSTILSSVSANEEKKCLVRSGKDRSIPAANTIRITVAQSTIVVKGLLPDDIVMVYDLSG